MAKRHQVLWVTVMWASYGVMFGAGFLHMWMLMATSWVLGTVSAARS